MIFELHLVHECATFILLLNHLFLTPKHIQEYSLMICSILPDLRSWKRNPMDPAWVSHPANHNIRACPRPRLSFRREADSLSWHSPIGRSSGKLPSGYPHPASGRCPWSGSTWPRLPWQSLPTPRAASLCASSWTAPSASSPRWSTGHERGAISSQSVPATTWTATTMEALS